jgi:hypothetical protein
LFRVSYARSILQVEMVFISAYNHLGAFEMEVSLEI